MKNYNPKEIEPKWQKIWDETNVYTANLQSDKPKYLAMSMFNYPSGAGIHIGHAMNYTISDVKARFKRQQGYESYHPVGWDAFGLPAENYAIKAGVSPQESMATIIPGYHKQYKAMGWSNDWQKEIATHTPEYYKWTQWIFAQMFKHKLAYQDARMQWWCTKCQTVLANEQIIDGKCWRHDGADDPIVEKKEVKQWFFKITEYADELLEAIDDLDWTESVKLAQKNWIGRSVGAEVDFTVKTDANYVLLHGFTGNSKEDFFPWAKNKLEAAGHNAYVPDMPNTDKPDAKEQAVYVLDNTTFDENTVLLGHSYGSVTALRIAEQLKKPIKKLVLVAGFAEPLFLDTKRNFEDTTDWEFDFDKIKANVGEVVLLRASNDTAVPQERTDYLQSKLGGTIIDFKAEDNHVCGKVEPVVLQNILPTVRVFTTRPDTLFGATFMVVAPEADIVAQITTPDQKAEVDAYVKATAKKTEVERQAAKQKTGVFTGAYAVNPLSGDKMPIWVADYVLAGYGTGAVMAVPAHDQRDNEFAQKYDLPIKIVVEPTFGQPQGDEMHKKAAFITLHNPKTDKVVVLDWGPRQARHGGKMLIGGGLEGDESFVDAAKREITEETGYKNFKLVREADFLGHGYFYSDPKDKNMHVTGKGLLFELLDEEKVATNLDEGEKDKFKVTWEPVSKVATMLDDGVHEAFYRHLMLNECYHGEGVMVNSGKYDGMPSSEAREKIVADLAKNGQATEKVNYKMRDWSVSRQRYWGAPIPIVNCDDCGTVLVPDDQLPVVLPELTDFQPSGDGRSALARAKDWLKVDCPNCGKPAERETDTLDTYICSSWYMYRYMDPFNQEKIFDSKVVNKWAPVDFYNGGDHATAHLLYARFVARFFTKIGIVDNPEPFRQMLFNGKVMASDGSAFSKSKGNGIDPLEIINSGYGADALRTYLMFAAPLEFSARWDPQGVPGTFRFLTRLWNLVQEYHQAKDGKLDDKTKKALLFGSHTMVRKVTEDLQDSRYNTAIAAAMTGLNDLYAQKKSIVKDDTWQEVLENIVACVAPFAPHVAEELWNQLGHSSSIHKDSWPEWDQKHLVADTITVVVQVNGKVRGQLQVATDSSEDQVVAAAKNDDKVAAYLDGKDIKKTIYVAGKLVSFVVA